MTFIQPKKNKNILKRVLALSVICTVFCSLWLVFLYNTSVNVAHGILKMKSDLADVNADTLAVQNEIFEAINAATPLKLGLVQDKNPEYIEIRPQWSYASDL